MVKVGGGETGGFCLLLWWGLCVIDALVVSKDTEPITTYMPLLAPFLSPALTFLPFWENRGGGGELYIYEPSGKYLMLQCHCF